LFTTLRVPLRKGRLFTEQDGASGPAVVIVDDELVKRYWPNVDPIGKRITFGNPQRDSVVDGSPSSASSATRSTRDSTPKTRVQLYFPYRSGVVGNMAFAVRTAGDPNQALPAIRSAIHAIDRDVRSPAWRPWTRTSPTPWGSAGSQ
jgi:putative ABC transport system permease protein